MSGFIGIVSPSQEEARESARRGMAALGLSGEPVVVRLGDGWLAAGPAREGERTGIAFHGALYNRAQLGLAEDTEAKGLAQGLERHGLADVARLRGMFAFAFWEPQRERLHLVRDRLGIKPLYWAQPKGRFLFATEVRALLATGLVPRVLDRRGLARMLAFGAALDPATLIEGVHALEPAHTLSVERGRVGAPQRYWALPTRADRRIRREEAVEELRRRLADAVSSHLPAGGAAGAFLSGGIDSSVVVALMAQEGAGPVRTATVMSEEGAGHSSSELPYAQLVARRYGTRHVERRLGAEEAAVQMLASVQALDQPSVDGANTFVASGAMRDAGCAIALSGLGGDELFAGYPHFRSLPALAAISRRTRAARLGRAASRLDTFAPPMSIAWQKAFAFAAASGDLGALLSRQRTFLYPVQQALLVRADWRLPEGMDPAPQLSPEETPDDPVNLVSAFELRTYVRDMLLRDAEAMGRAQGVELRLPLLDHELVEFVLSLPGSFKTARGRTKPLLVDAAGDLLPVAIASRRKQGFELALSAWLRTGLRTEVERVLFAEQPVFEPGALRTLWARFLSGDDRLATRVWGLYRLMSWLFRHVWRA